MGDYLFSYLDRLGEGIPDYVTGVTDLLIVQGAGGPVLYSTTRPGGGVAVFSLGPAAGAVMDSFAVGSNLLQLTPPQLTEVQVGAARFVLSIGLRESSLRGYRIDTDGAPSNLSMFSASGQPLDALTDVVSTTLNGQTVGFGSLRSTGLIRLDFLGGTGIQAEQLALSGPGQIHRISDMVTVDVGGTSYLLTAFATGDVISTYRITTTGNLQRMADAGPSNGLWIDAPTELAQTSVAGTHYVIVGSALSSTLTVVEIGSGGQITPVDHIADDLGTRFDNIGALDVIEVRGRTFVIAGGGDDGLSLFALLPGGRLLHLHSYADTLDTALANVSSIAAVEIGNDLHVMASSETDPTITRLTVSTADIGQTTAGTSGNDSLTGGAKDDFLAGMAGNDTLVGWGGRDVLLDGSGQDMLTGGAGADTFVMSADNAPDTITDFQAGVDQLDLTAFAGLAHWSQLLVSSRSWGAELRYLNEVIELRSATGGTITRAQMTDDWFIPMTRVSLETYVPITLGKLMQGTAGNDVLSGEEAADTIYGGDGNDQLYGSAGDDIIDGGARNDRIWGGYGEDSITGGDGNDTLLGDAGFDTLLGGLGNDLINGGGQTDRIWGGAGHDTILGESGMDNIWGEDGRDRLIGGTDNDRLWGGTGDDTLMGGTEADRLYGEGGNDILLGEGGFDLLEGGLGDDKLYGGNQADNLFGGDGKDSLFGGAGLDRLFGDNDNDLAEGEDGDDGLFGEGGDDTLRGGNGNDRFFGASGNDLLEGGNGNDIFYGGSGFDTIIGGAGNDTMSGKFNADTFVFADGFGHDVITDFNALNDYEKLDLRTVSSITGLADLLAHHAVQVGGNVVIDDLNGNTITLLGVSLSQLGASDFLF